MIVTGATTATSGTIPLYQQLMQAGKVGSLNPNIKGSDGTALPYANPLAISAGNALPNLGGSFNPASFMGQPTATGTQPGQPAAAGLPPTTQPTTVPGVNQALTTTQGTVNTINGTPQDFSTIDFTGKSLLMQGPNGELLFKGALTNPEVENGVNKSYLGAVEALTGAKADLLKNDYPNYVKAGYQGSQEDFYKDINMFAGDPVGTGWSLQKAIKMQTLTGAVAKLNPNSTFNQTVKPGVKESLINQVTAALQQGKTPQQAMAKITDASLKDIISRDELLAEATKRAGKNIPPPGTPVADSSTDTTSTTNTTPQTQANRQATQFDTQNSIGKNTTFTDPNKKTT